MKITSEAARTSQRCRALQRAIWPVKVRFGSWTSLFFPFSVALHSIRTAVPSERFPLQGSASKKWRKGPPCQGLIGRIDEAVSQSRRERKLSPADLGIVLRGAAAEGTKSCYALYITAVASISTINSGKARRATPNKVLAWRHPASARRGAIDSHASKKPSTSVV